MPSDWVPQSEYNTSTERVLERVRYLREPLEECLTQAIQAYFASKGPLEDKTKVTLACLDAVGVTRFNALSTQFRRSRNALKQDIGLFVPVLLVSLFGADNVQTYRNTSTRKASTRSNTWPGLDWVTRYTPHRILRLTRGRRCC